MTRPGESNADDLTPEDPRSAALRTALIDQLGYLVEEIEAVKAVIGLVSEDLLTARPPGEARSIKELYGQLAEHDAQDYLPRLHTLASQTQQESVPPGEPFPDWNALPIEVLLEDVQAMRRRLVSVVQGLAPPAWHRATRGEAASDVYTLAHRIIQHDAAVLQQISMRLHETQPARR